MEITETDKAVSIGLSLKEDEELISAEEARELEQTVNLDQRIRVRALCGKNYTKYPKDSLTNEDIQRLLRKNFKVLEVYGDPRDRRDRCWRIEW